MWSTAGYTVNEMDGSAREIVLDIVSGFGCRNDSGGIYKLTSLHWATPQGKVPISGDDSWCRLL